MQNQSIGDYPFYFVGDDYYFVTDDGRSYSMEFMEQPFFAEEEYAYAQNTYEVFLRLEKAPHAYATDPKIGATVTAIIQGFVSKDSSWIVFFTCDTTDGRQLARFRKFSFWFSEFQDGQFGRYDERITNTRTGKVYLIMMLLRNDNPDRANVILSYFDLTDQLRSQK